MSTPDNEPSRLEEMYRWIAAETGMDFSGERATRLREAVNKVWARLSVAKDRQSLSQGLAQQRGPLLEKVTAELTIGESFFFRNEHHFSALREFVIPQILSDNADKREVRLWSAGCAGGEEPYSLAILLDEMLSNPAASAGGARHSARTDWKVSVLATDLNPEFLTRARSACFRPWSFRQTRIHEDRRYFTPEGDMYRLEPRVRDCVRFAYLNLVKDVYPSPLSGTLGLDLILFRNVAIYLKPEVTQAIVARFYRALRPGGWLLLGESEVGSVVTDAFEVRRFEHATFHQKPKSSSHGVIDHSASVRPLLADIAIPIPSLTTALEDRQTAMRHPPILPDWVPLPKKRKTSLQAEHEATLAIPDRKLKASSLREIEQLCAQDRFEEAERAIERVANRQERARMRMHLVHACLAGADAVRARKMLSRTLVEEPLFIEAQLLHASLAEENSDWDIAEQAYRRALFIDRNCPLAHFHLALVQQQRGQQVAARRSLITTLNLIDKQDPHAEVQYGEGVCYGRLKEMTITILDG